MKKLLVLCCVLCLCPTLSVVASTTTSEDDSHLVPPLYGKVRIVNANADYKLQIVNEHAYLDIYASHGGAKLNALMAKAGASRKTDPKALNRYGFTNWEFVDSGEDFTVQLVTSEEWPTVKFIFDTTGVKSYREINAAESAAYEAKEATERAARWAKSEAEAEAAWNAKVAAAMAAAKGGISDCKCKGIPLYGRVQVVTAGADFRVEVVTAGADLRVKVIDYSPSNCGEWQFVDAAADFKIEFVNAGADFKIEYVEAAAGVR